MNAQTAPSIETALHDFVSRGEMAGVAALVSRPGRPIRRFAIGRRDVEKNLPILNDTIFRIASLTKPVTSVAALTLLDEGRFELDELITRVAPELANMRVLKDPNGPLDDTVPAARAITFRDLLTHRSGLTYAEFHRGPIGAACTATLGTQIDNVLSPDEWIAKLATLPLIDQPGANFHYGVSTDLLGFLMARIEGTSLSALMRRRVFEPLGMHDTGFNVPSDKRHRRAVLTGFDDAGQLKNLGIAPGSHALADRPDTMTFEGGGGGLFSTVEDYSSFARLFVGRGAVDGIRVLQPKTCALMMSNQLTPAQRTDARMFGRAPFAQGHGFGLGVAVVMEPEHADVLRCRGGVGTVGWPGAYGSWWQADPTDGSVLVFMSHNMVELPQLARGIGLSTWTAIATFHSLA
jgi:CubicO group peptidase (beta-lactamase class C family)